MQAPPITTHPPPNPDQRHAAVTAITPESAAPDHQPAAGDQPCGGLNVHPAGSGIIAEEPTILGFPVITLRDSIERPEALDIGGITMTGLDEHDAR